MFALTSTCLFGSEWATHGCKFEAVATYLDLSTSGPKAKLMQRVYNHAVSLHTYMGLPTDIASVPEEPMADEAEGEDKDIVYIHCLSGDASEGNDILICEGAHISATVGWH